MSGGIADTLTYVLGGAGPELAYGSTGAVRSISLNPDGTLGATSGAMVLPGPADGVSAVAYLQGTSQTFCYAAHAGTGQLRAYAVADQGEATRIDTGAQTLPDFSGLAILQTVTAVGGQFLLLADAGAQGVTSFRVDTDTGALSETGRLGAGEGLGINAPSAMAVVSAFGQTFVMAGGADDGLSMFSLLPDGRLVQCRLCRTGRAERLKTSATLLRYGPGITSICLSAPRPPAVWRSFRFLWTLWERCCVPD